MPHASILRGDAAAVAAAAFLAGTLAASLEGEAWTWLLGAGCVIASFFLLGRNSSITGGVFAIFLAGLFYYHLREPPPDAGFDYFRATQVRTDPPLAQAAHDLSRMLPYREGSLFAAFFGGSTSALAPDLRLAMERSGNAYLVGMYGYKIHLLGSAVARMAATFLPRRAALAAMPCAVGMFLWLAGWPRAGVRAGAMATIAAFAEASGRRFDPRRALLFAAVGMVLADPGAWMSMGFVLSLLSLAGIYVLSSPLRTCLVRVRAALGSRSETYARPAFWEFHLVITAAVNLAILPVVAVSYGEFPLVSFASNFFAGILFGPTLALGCAFAGAAAVHPAAAAIFAPALGAALWVQGVVARIFAAMPLMVPGTLCAPFLIAAYYGALIAFVGRVPGADPYRRHP